MLVNLKDRILSSMIRAKLNKYAKVMYEYDNSVQSKLNVCYYEDGECDVTDEMRK